MISFGPWEIPDGAFLSEISSYEKAKELPSDRILFVDPEIKAAQITGRTGSVYFVSLNNCTCEDFKRRELPCKHMIRLALELGEVFDCVPVFDPYAAYEFNVEELISQLEERWRNGQLTYDAFSKCASALRTSAKRARRPRRKKDSQ